MRQAFKGCVGKGDKVCGGGRFDDPAGLMLDSSALTLRDIFQSSVDRRRSNKDGPSFDEE
jgi:hypothetical protein